MTKSMLQNGIVSVNLIIENCALFRTRQLCLNIQALTYNYSMLTVVSTRDFIKKI